MSHPALRAAFVSVILISCASILASCGGSAPANTSAPAAPTAPAAAVPAPGQPAVPRAGVVGSCLPGEKSEGCSDRLDLWKEFQTTGDARLCDKMPEPDAAGCRRTAIMRAAKDAKDPSQCAPLIQSGAGAPSGYDTCVMDSAAGKKEWCDKIGDEMLRGICAQRNAGR